MTSDKMELFGISVGGTGGESASGAALARGEEVLPLPAERLESTLAQCRAIVGNRGAQVCEQEARLKYELGAAIARDWWDAGAAAKARGANPKAARNAVIQWFAERLRVDPLTLYLWKTVAEKIRPEHVEEIFRLTKRSLVGWTHLFELSKIGELKRDEEGQVLPDERREAAIRLFIAGELQTIAEIRHHRALVAPTRRPKRELESGPSGSVTEQEINRQVRWFHEFCPLDVQVAAVTKIVANLPTAPPTGRSEEWTDLAQSAAETLAALEELVRQKLARLREVTGNGGGD